MSQVGQKEIVTQQKVLKLLKDKSGYHYLGHWKDRDNNRNIEAEILRSWLLARGVAPDLANKAIEKLEKTATISSGQRIYNTNEAVYVALRYGLQVKPGPGIPKQTIEFIDWKNPSENEFSVAEEVTVLGRHTKRPDLVLYVNGIALAVIELKRSIVSVSEGIRQNLLNQKPEFIEPFFTTIQLVMAGNETEGLRYGVIETPEKYFLRWSKPDSETADDLAPLYRDLEIICQPERFLELIHDFMVFDQGIKKVCRHNQYSGVKAAQPYVQRREGGIIWHTQGSGKSLTMVWLAKWILEHNPKSRVLIITDRVELDEQIEKVFIGVGEKDIKRTKSGHELIEVLQQSKERLACSLIHKFGRSIEGNVGRYTEEIRNSLPEGFCVKGDMVVFIDECHRTQMGDLHRAMKTIMPDATYIGFTGTPLLKRDKASSREVFGDYIHTYKFDEAVRDGVVLDLRYQARDIDQSMTSTEKIDQWFAAKTAGLNDIAREELKKRWGTLQRVLSASSRLGKIVSDIVMDFNRYDRLISGRGNAMLVASSIYEACRYYELFQETELADHCALITSYEPSVSDIKDETTAEGQTEAQKQYDIYRSMLARHFQEDADKVMHLAADFEKDMRKRFIEEPGQLKLLIVVDKLLTGFDAPPATVLYIDKHMQDHGLFQAICRVNRLDGEDKTYGSIIDYKDLFQSLEQAVEDYTAGAFEEFDKEDVAGLLRNRLEGARERLEEVRELLKSLCESVPSPKREEDYIHYFCKGPDDAECDEAFLQRLRTNLYKLAGRYTRAYADLAHEMLDAGFTAGEWATIKDEVSYYEKVREAVKLASGDYIDLKQYEPAMRHLLDRYLQAEESRTLHDFDDLTLVDLLVRDGEAFVKNLPDTIKQSEDAVAETIENNVRKVIVDESASNPKYFAEMSELLNAILQERRDNVSDYEEFLRKMAELARKVAAKHSSGHYPASIINRPQRAFHDNLGRYAGLAVDVDGAIRRVKEAHWRGNNLKEKRVRREIARTLDLPMDDEQVSVIFEIALAQDDY
jgi:type I restriction enzyme R subunit